MSQKRAKQKRRYLKAFEEFRVFMGELAEEAFYQLDMDEQHIMDWTDSAMLIHQLHPELTAESLLPDKIEETFLKVTENKEKFFWADCGE